VAATLRVLLVAFYFPPTSGGGVERTLKLARHLPDLGVDVEVLVPTDAKWLAEDPGSLARIPPGLRVHRARYRGPSNRVLPGQRLAAATGLRRLALRAALAPRRLLLPDVEVAWLPDVVPAGRELLATGRFDALVTTAPPHSVGLAGAVLQAASGLPWLADWRDPWLDHADVDLGRPLVRLRSRALRPQARRVTARMSAATVVNEAIAAEVRGLRPGLRIEVVPNGVDLEELDGLTRRPDPRLTVVFAGYFFGDRHPRTFLGALADLLAERPELAGRIRARFLGSFREEDRRFVRDHGLDDVVTVEGTRSRAEVLQALVDADVLLVVMQEAAGRGAAYVPAKVWEYLAAARPVLALVPPEGAAARELRTHGTAEIVAPEDRAGTRAALGRLVAAWERGTLAGRPLGDEVRARISRRAGAERVADLLRELVAARPRP
jgi:glycosyltransferase involved in cell wall biosynthesis